MLSSFRLILSGWMPLAITCILVTGVYAQANPGSNIVHPLVPQMFAWTVEKWTADDKPYRTMRLSIFDAIHKGQDVAALCKAYKLQVQKHPRDPHSVFQYAYACYQASQVSSKFKGSGELVEAERSLTFVPPTHTYEYARLRFLIAAETFPRHYLKDVGVRLLAHDPNDIAVEWRLVTILDPADYPAEKQQALAYAFDLVKRMPNNPDAKTRLAGTYYNIWLGTEKKSDGETAIAAYQDYLKQAPENAAFRPRAEAIIEEIKLAQKRWDAKKPQN